MLEKKKKKENPLVALAREAREKFEPPKEEQ